MRRGQRRRLGRQRLGLADAGNSAAYTDSLSASAPWVAQSMVVQPASPCTTGGLTMGAPSAVSFPSTALDGTDRTAATNATMTVSDMTDTAVGWNLSAASTRFTSAGGDVLADTATTVTGLTITAGATNCGLPISTSSTFPMTLPAGATAPPAAKIYSSEIGSGLGQANLGMLRQRPRSARVLSRHFERRFIGRMAVPSGDAPLLVDPR